MSFVGASVAPFARVLLENLSMDVDSESQAQAVEVSRRDANPERFSPSPMG